MIRIYLRVAIPLIIIFIALNITARALGSTQPPNPALRGFSEGCEGKSQPCWYGIVPEVTTLDELEHNITLSKYELLPDEIGGVYIRRSYRISSEVDCSLIHIFHDGTLVKSVSNGGCHNLRIGDFFTIIDRPYDVASFAVVFVGDFMMMVWPLYHSGRGDQCIELQPLTQVDSFLIDPNTQRYVDSVTKPRWDGFLPYRWYVNNYDQPRCWS